MSEHDAPTLATLHARLAGAEGAGAEGAEGGDPARFLRRKVIEEGQSAAALAQTLSWPEADARSLLHAHRHHLRIARRVHQIGGYLVASYPQVAFTAIFQLLAILAGFALASAWQARQDALRDTRDQLSVLAIVAEEVASLGTEAARQARAENCKLEGVFSTRQWRGIGERGRTLVLGPLAREIQATYDVVESSASRRRQWTPEACREEARRLRGEIEVLDAAVTLRIKELDSLHTSLIASQARDDELKTVSAQLDVLNPLAAELGALSQRALTLSSAPRCTIEGLQMGEYEQLARNDGLLALGRLRRPVEEAYDSVALVRDHPAGASDVDCRAALTQLRGKIEPVLVSVRARIKELGARREALLSARSSDLPTIIEQARSSGLLRFLQAIMLWSAGVLVAVPALAYGAAYALMLVAAGMVR
jgi:hypothetical protein